VIVLIGFMGAGKTTVGTLLAARLGLPFTDSDHVIEHGAGRPIRQIFAEDGEPAFRALEHQTIAGLLDGPPAVLALGGGAPEYPPTRALLAPGGRPPGIPPLLGGSLSPQTPSAPLAPPSGGDPPPLALQTPSGHRAPFDVVYLHVGYDQALERVGGDDGRPLLARPDLPALYRRRLSVYEKVATLTVPTDGRPPEAVCAEVLARYAPS
jgi:shikimate kinase